MGAAPAITAVTGWGKRLASGWFTMPIWSTLFQILTITHHVGKGRIYLNCGCATVVSDLRMEEVFPDEGVIDRSERYLTMSL